MKVRGQRLPWAALSCLSIYQVQTMLPSPLLALRQSHPLGALSTLQLSDAPFLEGLYLPLIFFSPPQFSHETKRGPEQDFQLCNL